MFDLRNIFTWLRKNISKQDVFIILGIVCLYLLLRLINLEKFPIFTDEAIYIHWAKVAWHDATWRFISLTDGRQPLQTWATIPFLKLNPDNLLLGGRSFAVFSGFLTLSGLFVSAYYFIGKRAAYFVSLLYVITPMFLFHDRMALVDSMVSAFVVWMFLLSVLLAKRRGIDYALLLGIVGGFALLTKSSVKLFLGMTILSSLFIIFDEKKDKLNKLLSFGVLYLSVWITATVIYNIQRLSPFFHNVSSKNNTFVLTFGELLQNPFQLLFANIGNVTHYLSTEMAYVIPIFGLIGLFLLLKKKNILGVYVFLWLILSTIVVALIAKVLFPRYIMSLGVLLLLPAGYFLSNLKLNKAVIAIILAIASVSYFNYTILFAQRDIPFPGIDRGQYIEGWPAGEGIKEIVDYARGISKKQDVRILAEGNFGMSGDALDTHLKSTDTNIEIKGYWPLELTSLEENQPTLQNKRILVVFSHRSQFPSSWPIKKIAQYDKPGGASTIYLYELTQ